MKRAAVLLLALAAAASAFAAADTDKLVADARKSFEAGKFKDAAAKYMQAAGGADLPADRVADLSLQSAWASYIGGDVNASKDALKKAFTARPEMEVLPEFYSEDFARLAGTVKSQTVAAPKADLSELKRSARERLAGGLAQDVVYDLKRVGETNDPEIHRLLAEAYDKLGKSADADAERKKADAAASGITESAIGALPPSAATSAPAVAGPSDIAPLMASADEALGKQDWPAAAALAKTAQDRDPRSGTPHRVAGDAALGMGDAATAEREYVAASTLDPADSRAQIGLGRVADLAHQPNTAAAHYRKALELNPKSLAAALALGESLNQAGDKSAARQAFGRATEIAPGDAAARDRFGVFLAGENETSAAIEQEIEAVKVDPSVAAYHAHLGRDYVAAKSPREAERELREAVRLDDKDAASWSALGSVLLAAKNAEAADAFGHAIAIAPHDETALSGKAAALADAGKWEDAEAYLKQGTADNPSNATLAHDLGVVEFRLGRYDASVAAFQKATDLAPGSADSKAGLARATALRDFLAAARPVAPAAP